MREIAEFITRSGESEREKKSWWKEGLRSFNSRHDASILETSNWRFGMLPATLLDRGRGGGATSSAIHDMDRFITHLSAWTKMASAYLSPTPSPCRKKSEISLSLSLSFIYKILNNMLPVLLRNKFVIVGNEK